MSATPATTQKPPAPLVDRPGWTEAYSTIERAWQDVDEPGLLLSLLDAVGRSRDEQRHVAAAWLALIEDPIRGWYRAVPTATAAIERLLAILHKWIDGGDETALPLYPDSPGVDQHALKAAAKAAESELTFEQMDTFHDRLCGLASVATVARTEQLARLVARVVETATLLALRDTAREVLRKFCVGIRERVSCPPDALFSTHKSPRRWR